MVVTLNSSQVQQNFGAALDRALRGEDVVVERYGAPRVAMVDYDRYQRLIAAEHELLQARSAPAGAAAQSSQLNEAPGLYQVEQIHMDTEIPGSVAPTYRYVARVPGICGGQPSIQGTRIPVRAIVGYHKLGLSVDEILAGLPHLTPAQVYEALSYYYDHADEIEAAIRENQLPRLVDRYGLQVAADGRITVAS